MAVELYVDQFGVIHTATEQVNIAELVIHRNNIFYDTNDNIVLNLDNVADLNTPNTFNGELTVDTYGNNGIVTTIKENEIRLWVNKAANDATTSYGYLNYSNNGGILALSINDKDGGIINDLILYNNGNAEIHGNKIWHSGNMGAGTTLDADLLDGQHGTGYLRRNKEDSYEAKYLKLINSRASIAFDNTLATDGYGIRRITSNDDGGDFNIRNSCYFDGSLKTAKAGYGVTNITFNTDSKDGVMLIGVMKQASDKDITVNYDNVFNITTDYTYTEKQFRIDDDGLLIDRAGTVDQYLTINQNYNSNTVPAITSYSSISNAKVILYDSRTNDAADAPTNGNLGHQFNINGVIKAQILNNRFVLQNDIVTYGDIYFNNKALISSSGTNYDYLKHDDTVNRWNFVSEASNLTSGGNSGIAAGCLNLNGSNSINNIRPGYVLNMVGKQYQTLNTDPGDSSVSASMINVNITGSAVLSTDRNAVGQSITINDYYTGGDITNEHRVYGSYNYINSYGDADLVLGSYNLARSYVSDGDTTELKGSYNVAIASNSANGNIGALYGSHNLAYVDNPGSGVTYIYGTYSKGYNQADSDGDVTASYGLYAESEWSGSGALGYTAGVRSAIDIKSGSGPINSGALFRGDLYGTPSNTIYGVYINSDIPNYFRGMVQAGRGFTADNGISNGFKFDSYPTDVVGPPSAELYTEILSSTEISVVMEVYNSGDTIDLRTLSSIGLKHNGSTIWDSSNHGSDSGLNADLLDGVHGSGYLRRDIDQTCSGQIVLNKTNNIQLVFENSTQVGMEFRQTNFVRYLQSWNGNLYYGDSGDPAIDNKIWNRGNDGIGSGLDADLLRGLPADFTSNLDATGYQKLPSGLIIEWGSGTTNGVGIALPFTLNTVLSFSLANTSQNPEEVYMSASTTHVYLNNKYGVDGTVKWIVIGK